MTDAQNQCIIAINAQLNKLHTDHHARCKLKKNKSQKYQPVNVDELMSIFNLTQAEANQCIDVAFGFI